MDSNMDQSVSNQVSLEAHRYNRQGRRKDGEPIYGLEMYSVTS